MQSKCTHNSSFQIKSYSSPKEFEGMIHRTLHSYAYVLHLHFSVPLKSLLKDVIFLGRKSRNRPEKLWISHWKCQVGQGWLSATWSNASCYPWWGVAYKKYLRHQISCCHMIYHTGHPISCRQKDKVPPVHQIIPGVRGGV